MKRRLVLPIATAAIFFSAVLVLTGQAQDAADLLKQADAQFEKKNYKDAAQSYEAFIGKEPAHAKAHDAYRRLMVCNLRLQQFDAALEAAERYVAFTKGSHLEARAQRLLGNLYLTIPHWGTRAGGKFHRAQWKQGVRLRSERHDKSRAFAALERARALYAQFDSGDAVPEEDRAAWHEERIECTFDLAAACARFGIYENEWRFWYGYWGQRDEFTATTAGEADFDEYYGAWQLRRKRPIGLRVDAAGEPIFPTAPKAYAPDLNDDQRILFLLQEARNLDRTENHRYAALSWYRQAMLSRSRFGMDRLNSYAGMYWWGGRHPLQEDLKAFNPWELGDSETLVLAGGKIRKVKLPQQWDVISLLRMVSGDYHDSGLAPEANYSLGLYHQSRQQYKTALKEYHSLRQRHPDDDWAKNAQIQIDRILLPQVRISQAGLQLPGEPAGLQLSYRNTGKIWFVAREIFHDGFLRYL
ncbi:MAG: tetratricopeptide repeat protein, partial [Planctomycetota bacterium]